MLSSELLKLIELFFVIFFILQLKKTMLTLIFATFQIVALAWYYLDTFSLYFLLHLAVQIEKDKQKRSIQLLLLIFFHSKSRSFSDYVSVSQINKLWSLFLATKYLVVK